MDISTTTVPKSDQQNYQDYLAGPKTLTISDVKLTGGEQPLAIHVQEYPGRPYKPSKSMRRVLLAAWGKDGSQYIGRRLVLYGNPDIKWAGEPVGGIEISHLSDISKPITLALPINKKERKQHTVKPLPNATPAPDPTPHLDAINQAANMDTLRAAWDTATNAGLDKHPGIMAATKARRVQLEKPESGQ